MSTRDTSSKAQNSFQYTTHVHQAFNRQPASEQTLKELLVATQAIDISGGGSIDITTLAKEDTLVAVKNALEGTLTVNVADVSGLATEATQADLLLLAELQDLNGVKINQDHPNLTSYDFNNNHVLMTMLGPTVEDFRWNIDTKFNRDGWTFSTGNGEVLGSNCYWYANGAGTGNQTDLLYQDFTSWYIIVTIDNTGDVEAAPFIGAYSPPTGTNDIIPTFAHSRWVFALPGDAQLFQNEKVLLYYGDIPKVHSDLRHLPLSLVGSGGDRAPTEKIYLITTNTASGLAAGAVNYVNQGAGFVAKDIGREYYFSNGLARRQLANLSATIIAVQVSNFPLPVSSFDINNFPATQAVSGTVAFSNTSIEVSNLPATQEVSGTVAFSNTAIEVSNLPATQEVSGTVAFSNTSIEVSNLPATQEVSGTVAFSNTSIEVSNLPATQEVSGTVAFSNTSIEVSNLPATQEVSGTVAFSNTSIEVSNLPATQEVSGTVAFSNTVIDTHMYAKPLAAPMTQVHCDDAGYLLVGITDSAANRVTTTAQSTKQCLDINVCNLSTNQVQTRALTSSDVVSSNMRSGSGTAITATTVSTKTGLDVNLLGGTASAPYYCTPGVEVGANVNTGWSNSSLTATSVSTAIDIQWARTVSVLARASGTGTLVLQVSVDNTNWYTTTTTIVLAGTSDTVVNLNDVGARYVRLKSNSIVTGVFATIAAK
jgi:hypothetical protein